MIAEIKRNELSEEAVELRRLLRMGIAQVNAVVTGQPLAHERLRSMARRVRELLLGRLGGVDEPYKAEVAELNLLCAWPDDGDDIQCALRFDGLGRALLKAFAGESGGISAPQIPDDDLMFNDPFGC